MVTEEQKKVFKDGLNNIFNGTVKEKEETYQKTSQWFKNMYYRYINNTLPEEHKKALEKRLMLRNITIEEFMETKGNIDLLQELSKNKKIEKQNNKKVKKPIIEKSQTDELNEIIKVRDKLEKSINTLKSKITKRNRALYQLTDEACEEIEKQEDHNIIQKMEEENNQLRAQNEKYKESCSLYYHINRTLKEKNKKLKEKCKQYEEHDEYKIIQKQHLLNLFCTNENITLQEIKDSFASSNLPVENLLNVLNELRNEIPGITRVINEDGNTQSYSIIASATNRRDALKRNKVCPRISNIFTGIIEFVVIADLHADLASTEDDLKRRLDPLHKFCTIRNNLPIINLGDNADTLKKISRINWENRDKEAINLSYNFYSNYSKAIESASNIMHYELFGNHDQHPYLVGVDPLEIMNLYANNIIFLGIEEGSFMLGNDKLGVFHKNFNRNIYPFDEAVDIGLSNIANEYIYSLIGHYHVGIHRPFQKFSLIDNHFPQLFTVKIEDGIVKTIGVKEIGDYNKNGNLSCDVYQTEIYNSDYQYIKK